MEGKTSVGAAGRRGEGLSEGFCVGNLGGFMWKVFELLGSEIKEGKLVGFSCEEKCWEMKFGRGLKGVLFGDCCCSFCPDIERKMEVENVSAMFFV